MVGKRSNHPILVEVQVNGLELTMEVDTGAAVSIISEQRLKVLLDAGIKAINVKLRTYTLERIPFVGVHKLRSYTESRARK